jgi:hypothetical protein
MFLRGVEAMGDGKAISRGECGGDDLQQDRSAERISWFN